jgi:hypothetical protein
LFGEEGWFPCTSEYFYVNKCNHTDGHYPECKQCTSKKVSIWRDNNRSKVNAYNRKAREENRWNIQEIMRKNSQRRRDSGEWNKWTKTKAGQESAIKSRFNRMNKDHIITKEEWKSCLKYFNNSCAYCGLPADQHYCKYGGKLKLVSLHKEHVDHNGSRYLDNCVPSCRICNSSKHTFDLNEWYNEKNLVYNKDRYDKIIRWLNGDYKKYILNINN